MLSPFITIYLNRSATGALDDLVDKNTPLFEKSAALDCMLSASSFIGDTDIPNSCHGFRADQYAVEVLGYNESTFGCSTNRIDLNLRM